MITLVASTITKLIKAENRNRIFQLNTSTTARLALSPDNLSGGGGYEFSYAAPVKVSVPAGEEIFAIDSGTPNISLAEIKGQTTDIIELY